MKRLLLLVAVLAFPAIASADNFWGIGPKGQWTQGATTPYGGWQIQGGQYSSWNVTPSYGYRPFGYGYSQPTYVNYGTIYYAPTYSQRWGW